MGFYSVFMVADRVEVNTRSFQPEAEAVRWVSTGNERYELGPAEKASRGTDDHGPPEGGRRGVRARAGAWKASSASTPTLWPSRSTWATTQVNRRTALWRKSPREVSQEEYQEFYKQLTMDFEAPLTHVHVSADVPYDLHAILFVPARRERGMLRARQDEGLKLYSRKVLIQE